MPLCFPICVRSAFFVGQVFNLRRASSNHCGMRNFGALAPSPIENRPQVGNLPHNFCRPAPTKGNWLGSTAVWVAGPANTVPTDVVILIPEKVRLVAGGVCRESGTGRLHRDSGAGLVLLAALTNAGLLWRAAPPDGCAAGSHLFQKMLAASRGGLIGGVGTFDFGERAFAVAIGGRP